MSDSFFFFFSSTSLLLPAHLPPPLCTHAHSCNPMDFSPPDSSVHGFFQARILEWVAISFSIMSDSFVTPWTVAHQAPLSMGLSRQAYWTGLPFPSPGDLLDPGIEPASPKAGILYHWTTREPISWHSLAWIQPHDRSWARGTQVS